MTEALDLTALLEHADDLRRRATEEGTWRTRETQHATIVVLRDGLEAYLPKQPRHEAAPVEDITARLRAKAAKGGITPIGDMTIREAADTIDALRERERVLMEAVERAALSATARQG